MNFTNIVKINSFPSAAFNIQVCAGIAKENDDKWTRKSYTDHWKQVFNYHFTVQ